MLPTGRVRAFGTKAARTAASTGPDETILLAHLRRSAQGSRFHQRPDRVLPSLDRSPGRLPPIFCGNDCMATGPFDAVSETGLRIPDDLAVVGFDNRVEIADRLEVHHKWSGASGPRFGRLSSRDVLRWVLNGIGDGVGRTCDVIPQVMSWYAVARLV